jgi:hypothetical protein
VRPAWRSSTGQTLLDRLCSKTTTRPPVCRETSRADHQGLGAHIPVAGKCQADQVVVGLMA